jgi:Galactose oxidase, central domain
LLNTLSRVGLIMIALLFAACTQTPIADLGEQPTLEQALADNAPAINLFGSGGVGVHLLIRNVYDSNRNGRFDPAEAAIPDWGVRLTRINAQGIPLEASELQVTPETNAQRWHGVLVNVPAGQYKLEQLTPRPLDGVSWNATTNASRTVHLEVANLLVWAVEFTSVCLENAQVLEFPEAAAFGAWKCKPGFDLAPRISKFTVSPNEVKTGEHPTFSWTVADNAKLEIDEGVGPLSEWTGSLELTPSDSARYTLTARNAFGSSHAQVSLRVSPNGTNGTFSSAGSTSGTVFSGTVGAKYIQVPGLGLSNGQVVVGKIPYETIGLDGPLQARIQGFYLFDPSSSTFSIMGQIKNPNDSQTYRYTLEDAVPLAGSKVMLHKIPDVTVPGMPELYERYDFATDEYTSFDGPVGPTYSDGEPYQEFLVRQFSQGDKVILVIACAGDPKKVRVETYYLNTGATDSSFCSTDPDYQVPNSNFTLLKDGTFLITGGLIGQNPGTKSASSSARVFDPKTQSIRKISNMKYARHFHSTTLLSDGRVLISGGTSGSGNELPLQYVTESEIYDPRTERFTQVGNLLEGRLEPTNPRTFTLPNGKLLLLDTYHPNAANAKTIFRPELFDPVTGKFGITGDMLEPRWGFSAVQLQNGQVFIYGGFSSDGLPLSSAEIYKP